jgi:glycosyltransferase involved in cell wall biosynthesis
VTKRHIVYVVSLLEKSLAFEWVLSRLAADYRVTVILLSPAGSSFETFLNANGIRVVRIKYRSKVDFPIAFIRTFFFMVGTRPAVVHAHLLDAQLIGLGAAWLAGIRRRIYTRHTSTFHHTYHPAGVRYDKLSNWLATKIVSVSQATDHSLINLEKVRPNKVVRIPHGVHMDSFVHVPVDRVNTLRKKWSIPPDAPTIGVVARLIEWKGVEFAINAFASFQRKWPMANLVIANASGPEEQRVLKLLHDLGARNVTMIPFEADAPAMYRLFDILVHVPVDLWCEAFGQVYVEAMASGVPMIVTRSGIAAEFVADRENAMVVPYRDSAGIETALELLWDNEELRIRLVKNARRDVASRFGIDDMVSSLKRLYNE